jgi:hypothetical protein
MECCKKKKDNRVEKLILLIEELNEQQKQIVECIAKLQQAVNTSEKK